MYIIVTLCTHAHAHTHLQIVHHHCLHQDMKISWPGAVMLYIIMHGISHRCDVIHYSEQGQWIICFNIHVCQCVVNIQMRSKYLSKYMKDFFDSQFYISDQYIPSLELDTWKLWHFFQGHHHQWEVNTIFCLTYYYETLWLIFVKHKDNTDKVAVMTWHILKKQHPPWGPGLESTYTANI